MPTFNNDIPPNYGGLVYEPNMNDVLCGRGGRINAHPGNVQFRNIVKQFRGRYISPETKKLDKSKIATHIVEIIRGMNPPGRFLKEDQNAWVEIGDERARKKTGQAMREKDSEKAESKSAHSSQTASIQPRMMSGPAIPTPVAPPVTIEQQLIKQMEENGYNNVSSSHPTPHSVISDNLNAHQETTSGLRPEFEKKESFTLFSHRRNSHMISRSSESFQDSFTSTESSKRELFKKMKSEESVLQPLSLSQKTLETSEVLDENELLTESLASVEMQSMEFRNSRYMESIGSMKLDSLSELVDMFGSFDGEQLPANPIKQPEKKKVDRRRQFASSGANSISGLHLPQVKSNNAALPGLPADMSDNNHLKGYPDYSTRSISMMSDISQSFTTLDLGDNL